MTLIVVGTALVVIALVMAWYGRGGNDDAAVQGFKVSISGKSWLVVLAMGVGVLTFQWYLEGEHTKVQPAPTTVPGEFTEAEFDYDRLSALWDDCGLGDNAACDALWQESPIGSDWELYGSLCGERLEEEQFGECVAYFAAAE